MTILEDQLRERVWNELCEKNGVSFWVFIEREEGKNLKNPRAGCGRAQLVYFFNKKIEI